MAANTHQTFLNNLRRSTRAVDLVAAHLAVHGYNVTVSDTREAPTHEQWQAYADHGDLFLQMRVEVKQISRLFTGRADWPFSKFIVCARHSFDRARPKPAFYYIVSPDGEHYACVDVNNTSGRWTVETRRDARYSKDEEYKQDFYLCPLELVKWGRLGREQR